VHVCIVIPTIVIRRGNKTELNEFIKLIENVVEIKYTIEEECKAKAESNTVNRHILVIGFSFWIAVL